MISKILSSNIEYILASTISVVIICIIFMFIFSKSSRLVLKRFLSTFLSILISNVLLFSLIAFVVSKILGYVSKDLGVTSLLFLISLTIIFNTSLILKLKLLLPKAKKFGDLSEVSDTEFSENKHRSVNLLILFTLIITPIIVVAFGNWEILSVLIYVAVSTFICSLTSIFLFPILFNTFNRVVK